MRRFFPPARALALTLLAASASAAPAQVPATKLDPLLRPLTDPAVIARIEATPRVEAVGAALRRPLADVVVHRGSEAQGHSPGSLACPLRLCASVPLCVYFSSWLLAAVSPPCLYFWNQLIMYSWVRMKLLGFDPVPWYSPLKRSITVGTRRILSAA